MYTRKNKKNTKKAISIIHKNDSNITGYIKFVNTKRGVKVIYNIKGMEDGLHGFHIHEYGDLHNGCDSAGAHFNPDKNLHSGRKNAHRHVGDLGNLLSENYKACGYFYAIGIHATRLLHNRKVTPSCFLACILLQCTV